MTGLLVTVITLACLPALGYVGVWLLTRKVGEDA